MYAFIDYYICYIITVTILSEFSATGNSSSVAKLCVLFLGDDWIYSSMKRHPNQSLRTAETTSLTRSTNFNRTNVATFYSNLKAVLVKHKFEAFQIYNIDETALITVHKPPKVVAQKNCRQVRVFTSAECGTLVTLVEWIKAEGGYIPPFLIIPRVMTISSLRCWMGLYPDQQDLLIHQDG